MEDVGIIAKHRLVSKKRECRITRERDDEMDDDDEVVDTDPDGEDEDDESTETLARLLNWFKGPQAAECRRVAGASPAGIMNGVTGLSGEQGQRPSFIAEYVTSIQNFLVMFVDFRFDTEGIGESEWC